MSVKIDDTCLDQLLQVALGVVQRAAEIAQSAQLWEGLDVRTKSGRNDLVTAIDQAVEEHVAQALSSQTGLPLLGEEGHAVDSFAGLVWVLDPVDGTMNLVETRRDYAVSLALCLDGVPVIGVVRDVVIGHTYSAVRGKGACCDGIPLPPVGEGPARTDCVIITDLKEIQALPRLAQCLVESRGHRRYGSAALECVEVACGRAGAFVHMWVSPWDIAAAALICAEAGVRFTRLDGTPLDVRYQGSVLVAPPRTHQELLQRLMIDAA
ncbi:Inositol-1-monophosphatase ImpA [Actinomyces bovis]|uniref:Inositol-1-monophosphatase ImpA n=1 Tax=Actinomyces bovis TaxID=1658 RepID=A0ABY1VJX7_9ACTO|nr:inositol monophosphatase family protein [Actinomyces bovis]SPT52410.1 Inositol-1-monophosphatase ImpA [Actinomyces bovis]VEG54028.1 Inositol-1-monophosphatase ImpA [Actinomyces israelii]